MIFRETQSQSIFANIISPITNLIPSLSQSFIEEWERNLNEQTDIQRGKQQINIHETLTIHKKDKISDFFMLFENRWGIKGSLTPIFIDPSKNNLISSRTDLLEKSLRHSFVDKVCGSFADHQLNPLVKNDVVYISQNEESDSFKEVKTERQMVSSML